MAVAKGIVNYDLTDSLKSKMFFGEEGLGVQRYDKFKYPKIFDNYEKQLSMFWRPQEVSLQKDRSDFKILTNGMQFLFTENIKYQIILDTFQSRIIRYLLECTTLPELEAAANAWLFYEQLHSYSYTYIIKNIYNDIDEVYDSIFKSEVLLERAKNVTKYYDEFINEPNDKLKLLKCLVAVNILEGIRFYVSFACSYAFQRKGLMEGNAKIIYLINRDEYIHLALTQNMLNTLRKNADEGFAQLWADNQDLFVEMYKDAADEETKWAEHLFQEDSLLGLNANILTQYMHFLTNQRMRAIGLPILFKGANTNPMTWIDNFSDSDKIQVAPQETELESYLIGAIKNDIHDMDFE